MSAHYLTVAQADEAYPAIGRRMFRRLIAEGRIPYSKVGAKVVLSEEDIEALIAAGRVEPRPPHAPLKLARRPRRAS